MFYHTREKERGLNIGITDIFINLLNDFGKVYGEVLVVRICRMTESLIDDNKGLHRSDLHPKVDR